MALPAFSDLPFTTRPDLTPYLLHLTKNSEGADRYSALDNLVSILTTARVWGSSPKTGYIKGGHSAACFMDVPFPSLKYVLTPENTNPAAPRYEPYGVAVTKPLAYRRGCRPVLYLADAEISSIGLKEDHLWRVVRFERSGTGWISFMHEREWRCKGDFRLPKKIPVAFVRTSRESRELTERLHDEPSAFKCRPRNVVALEVICQGLLV